MERLQEVEVILTFSSLYNRTFGMHTVSAREYGYDAYDRLAWVENEWGERYAFERDLNGEVIAERGFDGRERRYGRDMDGTVLVTHLPDGTTIHHQHDLAGRLTYSRYPDGSWETWEYDRAGRLCKASDPHGETVFERDALGRIIREVRDGHTIEHCYDSRSRLTRTLSDLGADITHGYDDAGLPESVKAIMQGMPHPWEARLQHDRLGRETLRTMTGGVACAMQYDGVGRPSRQSVTRGGHSLYNKSYRWDDDFRLSHAHDAISGRIVRYFYDDFGSLAEAEYGDGARQLRNPDIMGNVYDSADRTDRTYARGGQLREDRRWRYHYDKQGNLVLKTKRKISPIAETPQGNRKSVFGLFAGSNTSKERREQEGLIAWQPGDYAYAWLPNGMLGSVTRPDGKVVTFKYDALGRRIEKSFNGRVHRYLWDGDVILHEWEYDETDRPQEIVAENGEVAFDRPEPTDNLVTWIYDIDSYVPTAKLVGGKRYGIVSDYIGRPVQAYDEHGTPVWQADYDIYGNLLNLKGNRKFLPFRQLGQYEDEETELYYNRFRYYDPSTGGYISQDPIGLAGNNPTLYAYVSDANSWVDLFGLDCDKATSKAREYEQQIQDMYGGKLPQSQREYGAIVGGTQVNGIADHVANINGKNVAIDAKYVKNWSKSIRNPNSSIGNKPFAIAEQQNMVSQAQKYSNAFDEVIYHTNNQDLATHYTRIFQDAGLNNVKIIVTP